MISQAHAVFVSICEVVIAELSRVTAPIYASASSNRKTSNSVIKLVRCLLVCSVVIVV